MIWFTSNYQLSFCKVRDLQEDPKIWQGNTLDNSLVSGNKPVKETIPLNSIKDQLSFRKVRDLREDPKIWQANTVGNSLVSRKKPFSLSLHRN